MAPTRLGRPWTASTSSSHLKNSDRSRRSRDGQPNHVTTNRSWRVGFQLPGARHNIRLDVIAAAMGSAPNPREFGQRRDRAACFVVAPDFFFRRWVTFASDFVSVQTFFPV